MHEYIVEDLSGEFEAVFINLELVLSIEPARLTEIYIQDIYVQTHRYFLGESQ